MSALQPTAPSVDESTTPDAAPTTDEPTRRPLKLIVPVVVLAVFWAFTTASHEIEMAMFTRFISRMIANLILLVFFVGWGLSNRHFHWREKLAAAAIVIGGMIVGGRLAHPSVGGFGMFLGSLPWVLTAGIGWLLVSRRLSDRGRLVGFAGITLAILGFFTLIRWEGLDGRQQSTYAWRWTPTAEQEFLAQHNAASAGESGAESPDRHEVSLLPGDWPAFRGPEADSMVTGVPLGDWNANPPPLVWRRKIGPGWSSLSIAGGLLFTQEQRGDVEAVVAYEAATGDEVWAHTDTARFEEALSGPGPRATPTFHDGRIYAYGATGRLNCLDAASGDVVWTRDLLAEVRGGTPQWGLSVSPLVLDDLVIVFAGGAEGRALVACRTSSGETAWTCAGGANSYSSPQALRIAGVPQVVMHDDHGLYGVDPSTGEKFWEHTGASATAVPMLQPHLVGDSDLIVGWESGIRRLALERAGNEWTVTPRWTSNRLKPSFNDFQIQGEYIYGLDDGILCCVGLSGGQRQWKRGRYGFGQLLGLPDTSQILVLSEQGEVVLVAADPEEFREIGRFKALDGKTWNHPAVGQGILYVRNGEELACFRLADDAIARVE